MNDPYGKQAGGLLTHQGAPIFVDSVGVPMPILRYRYIPAPGRRRSSLRPGTAASPISPRSRQPDARPRNSGRHTIWRQCGPNRLPLGASRGRFAVAQAGNGYRSSIGSASGRSRRALSAGSDEGRACQDPSAAVRSRERVHRSSTIPGRGLRYDGTISATSSVEDPCFVGLQGSGRREALPLRRGVNRHRR